MLTNLNSLQDTIKDLKTIVDKNQGTNHETTVLVNQIEQLVCEIERKTRPAQSIPEQTMAVHSQLIQSAPIA